MAFVRSFFGSCSARTAFYVLPLPPFAELQRKVAKVKQLQQQVSQLEVQVQQSKDQAELLLQMVLKEAFGEKNEYAEEVSMAQEEDRRNQLIAPI